MNGSRAIRILREAGRELLRSCDVLGCRKAAGGVRT
jgi:hypothetical protein